MLQCLHVQQDFCHGFQNTYFKKVCKNFQTVSGLSELMLPILSMLLADSLQGLPVSLPVLTVALTESLPVFPMMLSESLLRFLVLFPMALAVSLPVFTIVLAGSFQRSLKLLKKYLKW